MLSNSTPTCRPNLTLVGLSMSWLCFPLSQEGRRRKSPHLVSIKGNDPTCLKFGGCLKVVLSVSWGCLEGVRRVSELYQEGCWIVSAGCLEMCKWCLDCVWRASHDWSIQDWSTQHCKSRYVNFGQVNSMSSEERSSQERTNPEGFCMVCLKGI